MDNATQRNSTDLVAFFYLYTWKTDILQLWTVTVTMFLKELLQDWTPLAFSSLVVSAFLTTECPAEQTGRGQVLVCVHNYTTSTLPQHYLNTSPTLPPHRDGKNIWACEQCSCEFFSSWGKNLCRILLCYVAKVMNVAILRFYCHSLAFYDNLWHFMVLFGIFMALYVTFWHFCPATLFCGEFTFVTIFTLFG